MTSRDAACQAGPPRVKREASATPLPLEAYCVHLRPIPLPYAPLRPVANQPEAEMANVPDMAVVAEALANSMNRVIEAINQHQQQQAIRQEAFFVEQQAALQNLVNDHGMGPREFFSALPRYAGDPNDLEDWIARAERIKDDREIHDVAVIRECGGKLDGLAAEWHNQIGANQINWAEWLKRLRNSFGRPMSANEWQCLFEARVQMPGESVAAYVFDKVKLLRRCPQALNESGYITYLVRGLNNPETRSALSRNAPNTVDGLMTRINQVQA